MIVSSDGMILVINIYSAPSLACGRSGTTHFCLGFRFGFLDNYQLIAMCSTNETKTAKDWKRPLKKCNCFLKVGACTVSTVYFYLNPSSCQLAWFIQAFSLSSSVQKYGNKATVSGSDAGSNINETSEGL